MLQPNPQPVHLAHVLQYKVDSVVDVAALSLVRRIFVGEDVLHHLHEVVAEEEASGWLLHAFDHVEQVF